MMIDSSAAALNINAYALANTAAQSLRTEVSNRVEATKPSQEQLANQSGQDNTKRAVNEEAVRQGNAQRQALANATQEPAIDVSSAATSPNQQDPLAEALRTQQREITVNSANSGSPFGNTRAADSPAEGDITNELRSAFVGGANSSAADEFKRQQAVQTYSENVVALNQGNQAASSKQRIDAMA